MPVEQYTSLSGCCDDVLNGTGEDGKGPQVLDISKLDRKNRQLITAKALATEDQDHEQLLTGMQERMKRSVGLFCFYLNPIRLWALFNLHALQPSCIQCTQSV